MARDRNIKGIAKSASVEKKYLPYLLIIPCMFVLLILNIYPFIETLRLSFFQWVLTKPHEFFFVGVSNYVQLFKDSSFWNALFITIKFVFFAVSIEMILGYIIASLLAKPIKFSNVYTSLTLVPMIISPVVVGLFWRAWFAPSFGLVNYFLKLVGLAKFAPVEGFLGNPSTALATVIAVDIWEWTPFVVLIFLAGLKSLPSEPLEAAQIDGATGWQTFTKIIIPLLKPVILVVMLFRVMDAYKIFDTIWIMTKGGPSRATETMSILIYKNAFMYWNIGYSTAMAYIMLILSILFCTFMVNKIGFEEE